MHVALHGGAARRIGHALRQLGLMEERAAAQERERDRAAERGGLDEQLVELGLALVAEHAALHVRGAARGLEEAPHPRAERRRPRAVNYLRRRRQALLLNESVTVLVAYLGCKKGFARS